MRAFERDAIWTHKGVNRGLQRHNSSESSFVAPPSMSRTGGRWNPRRVQTHWDKVESHARSLPGVCDYDPDPTASRIKGGRFKEANEPGLNDDVIARGRELPGPHESVPPAPSPRPGGKFSTSKPKGSLEWIQYFASQVPGPADYSTMSFPQPDGGRFAETEKQPLFHWVVKRAKEGGQSIGTMPKQPQPEGGRFPHKSTTYLERLMNEESERPGPQDYVVKRGDGKIEGGRFSLGKPKSDVEWKMYRAAQIPGPANYNTRSKVSRRGGAIGKAVATAGAARQCAPVSGLHEHTIELAKEVPGPVYNPKPARGYRSQHVSSSLGVNSPSMLDELMAEERQKPGPGDYLQLATFAKAVTGGRFNVSNSKSELELMLHNGARCPGPLDYSVMDIPIPKGGRLSHATGKLPGFLDSTEKHSRLCPGPGAYERKSGFDRTKSKAFAHASTGRLTIPSNKRAYTPPDDDNECRASDKPAPTKTVSVRVNVCTYSGKVFSLKVDGNEETGEVRARAERRAGYAEGDCLLMREQTPLVPEDQPLDAFGRLVPNSTLRLAKRAWLGY